MFHATRCGKSARRACSGTDAAIISVPSILNLLCEKQIMQTYRIVVIGLFLAAAGQPARAQFSADAKISGNAFRHYQARTYQQHARDYSQMLYYQARCAEPMNPQVAKQQAAAIRTNVAAANKELDKIKQAHAGKPDVAKTIDKIKERHAKVIVKCDELEQHLAMADKDTTVICDCCVDAIEELDAAAAETEKLMKDLKLEPLPKPTKTSADPKKKAPAKK
jgi:hypothetical protein